MYIHMLWWVCHYISEMTSCSNKLQPRDQILSHLQQLVLYDSNNTPNILAHGVQLLRFTYVHKWLHITIFRSPAILNHTFCRLRREIMCSTKVLFVSPLKALSSLLPHLAFGLTAVPPCITPGLSLVSLLRLSKSSLSLIRFTEAMLPASES